MDIKKVSAEDFVTAQIEKWKASGKGKEEIKAITPVITLCTEPASGGRIIAERVAKLINYQYFHHNVIKEIAESVEISDRVIRSIEKERFSGIQDFISSIVNRHYLWPGLYLQHLMNVINVIAEHGDAVIVGRGANFILPPEKCFSVLIVAPLRMRIENTTRTYGVSSEKAKRRILNRESKRKAFVRQSFHKEISEPTHYDMVLNTGRMCIDGAVECIINGAKVKGKRTLPPIFIK